MWGFRAFDEIICFCYCTFLKCLIFNLFWSSFLKVTTSNEKSSSSKPRQRKPATDKGNQCEVCHKSFFDKSTMNKHMKIHTGQKPYSCNLCGKAFSQNSTLKSHMRVHSGEKPFSCDVCDLKFTEKGNMLRHRSTHTGMRVYISYFNSCSPESVFLDQNICVHHMQSYFIHNTFQFYD